MQAPETDRELLMLTVLYYPNGLDGTVGDLVLLPGSQRVVMEQEALQPLFGDPTAAACRRAPTLGGAAHADGVACCRPAAAARLAHLRLGHPSAGRKRRDRT